MSNRTDYQLAQDDNKDTSGRFKKGNVCDCCGGRAPHQYYSETSPSGRYWHVLCRKCAVRIADGAEG